MPLTRYAVVYESSCSDTAKVAESITEGLSDAGVEEIRLDSLDSADLESVHRCEAILVGSPNLTGRPTRRTLRFIRKLSKRDMTGKRLVFFETCGGEGLGKAVERMEEDLTSRCPEAELVRPGLALKMEEGQELAAECEMSRAREFARRLAESSAGTKREHMHRKTARR